MIFTLERALREDGVALRGDQGLDRGPLHDAASGDQHHGRDQQNISKLSSHRYPDF
jgi:hypothetical protein